MENIESAFIKIQVLQWFLCGSTVGNMALLEMKQVYFQVHMFFRSVNCFQVEETSSISWFF